MKKFYFLLLVLFLGCTSYRDLVNVQSRSDVPDGTMSILVHDNIDNVKQVFIRNGIMLKSLEGGFETETILLDEGTRAMYKLHDFDEHVRVTAFWGITQKVKSQMTVWAGHAASSAYDVHAFDQVIYNRSSARPKKVFDYAVQLLDSGQSSYVFR